MARFFLSRIKVEGFRGINNEGTPLDIKFKVDEVNSVFAENGIGKSSLFEALHYAIYGSIPKLDDMQVQEKPDDYYCNRFHSGGVAIIDLEFQPDDGSAAVSIHVERDAAGQRIVTSMSGHTDPELFLRTQQESFALLDYRTFARFIDESPLERGRTFSALLGLADYSDCRQALQSVSDTRSINTDLDVKVLEAAIRAAQSSAQQSLGVLRTSFENITGKHLEDIGKLDECADEIADALSNVELLKTHLAGKQLGEIDFDSIKQAIKDAESGEQRKDLATTIQNIAAIETLRVPDQESVVREQQAIQALIAERDTLLESTRGDLFKNLHESAQEVLQGGVWDKDQVCPLCESDLPSSITAHIEGQLAQYRDAGEKITEIKETWAASRWRAVLGAHESTSALAVEAQMRKLPDLDAKVNSGRISAHNIETAISRTNELDAQATSALEAASKRKEEIEQELPESLVQLTEQVEYGRQFKEALEQLRNSQKLEANEQARLDIRERWRNFIGKVTTTYSDAEAALSKARIAGIDSEYKSMFHDIMQIGDVVPELQRAGDKEHLHVQLKDFHGQHRLSARALLSESYRNALAISVFLAAALKHSGAPRFVVLDDVTSSFDAGHQWFLMDLIRTKLQHPVNPNGLQFVILSHDGLLEKYFDRLNGVPGWNHNKLQGSPPTGTILQQSQSADRLKTTIASLISAGQIDQAKPLIRQYLEFKLQQIIRKVDIPVPFDFAIKDSSRMVQNCLDAIKDAIKLHKAAGSLVLDTQQEQDLTTSYVPAIVGNWVSHYGTGSGASLSAHVLNGVVSTIDDLAECFRYDDMSVTPTTRNWYRSLSQK